MKYMETWQNGRFMVNRSEVRTLLEVPSRLISKLDRVYFSDDEKQDYTADGCMYAFMVQVIRNDESFETKEIVLKR